MSYQVIARKWRPQAFEEVTGQETVTRTLRNALEFDRLHHAYLFSGARGVGKTTTARLLAKALNCHKTTKPNLHPCKGTDATACPSCIEISEGRSIDVLEIDAASHTGIDDVRGTILDSININPARDRHKVFIIDEVHQLSKQAFNGLLKTIEEPPPNVVFIMATTELHKVPETILSRCQEFEFRTIPVAKIFDRLKIIADAEKITIGDDALREIARSGEGSMRDAQSNFDQVISFAGETIAVDDVTSALGIAGSAILKRILSAIAAKNSKEILDVVDEIVSRGQDLRNFCRDLLGLFRDLMVLKVAGNSEALLESATIPVDEMKSLSAPFSASDVIRFFNSLSETETKLREAAQSRYVLEIGLVKLAEMQHVAGVEALLERLTRLEAFASGTANSLQPQQAAAAPEKKTLAAEIAVVKDDPPPVPEVPEEPSLPEPEPVIAEKPRPDLRFLDNVPIKLSPISSEDLEHVDDTWLDAAYEDRLTWSGDDLGPIKGAEKIAEDLIGVEKPEKGVAVDNSNGASSAAAAVRALERADMIPVFEESESTAELPKLSENPSEEELLAYAQSHPLVKQAIRVFRGKIVEIKKR